MDFPSIKETAYYVDCLHNEANFQTNIVEEERTVKTKTVKLRANEAYLYLVESSDKRIGTCLYLIIKGFSTSDGKPFQFSSRIGKIINNELVMRSAGGSILNAVYVPLLDMFKSITREVTFILKCNLVELEQGNTTNYQSYNEEGNSLLDSYFTFEFQEGTNDLQRIITPDGTFFSKEERKQADEYLLSAFGWLEAYSKDRKRKIPIPFSNYHEVIQQEETSK